jgi:hypothetical protein
MSTEWARTNRLYAGYETVLNQVIRNLITLREYMYNLTIFNGFRVSLFKKIYVRVIFILKTNQNESTYELED